MADLNLIFQQEYRELRPRAPMPDFEVRHFPFVNINNTIRLRKGRITARLSDVLESAPEPVLRALSHILLAKLYRKPVAGAPARRYRQYVTSQAVRDRAEQLRGLRGRKIVAAAQGSVYDLNAIFDKLNTEHFWGLMARPQMMWSRERARVSLGHYDSAHNAIVVSRVFDSPRVPLCVVEYIVYHEMLHLRHPVKVRNSRRCVHSREFQAEEKLFPDLERAKEFLKKL